MLQQPLRMDLSNVGGSGGAVDYKNARIVATVQALPAYTRVGNTITANAAGALPAIDGESLALLDSFLLRNGAALEDNGPWDVTDLGSGGTPWVIKRSADADTSAKVTSGMRVPILKGTFAGLTFFLATADPIILNTTGLVFALDKATGDWKAARLTASTAALPAYTRVGNTITENAPGALPAIGGVAVPVGQSFLLQHGAAGADNGLWDVADAGSGGTPFVLTRSPDASSDATVVSGIRVAVTGGFYAGQVFYLLTANPITLNATALTFALASVPTGVTRAAPIARGAYVARSADPVQGVAVTPGWVVIAEFDLDVAPTAGAVLDGIVLVSQGALTGRLKLYDVTAAGDVAGSTLSTSSTTGARLTSADLTAVLTVAHRYQIQAECTGGATSTDWSVVRYAGVFPS